MDLSAPLQDTLGALLTILQATAVEWWISYCSWHSLLRRHCSRLLETAYPRQFYKEKGYQVRHKFWYQGLNGLRYSNNLRLWCFALLLSLFSQALWSFWFINNFRRTDPKLTIPKICFHFTSRHLKKRGHRLWKPIVRDLIVTMVQDILVAPLNDGCVTISQLWTIIDSCCLSLVSKKPFSINNARSSNRGRPSPPC